MCACWSQRPRSPGSVTLLLHVRTPIATALLRGGVPGPPPGLQHLAWLTPPGPREQSPAPEVPGTPPHLGPSTPPGVSDPSSCLPPPPSFLLLTSPCFLRGFPWPLGQRLRPPTHTHSQGPPPSPSSSALSRHLHLPPHPRKTVSTLGLRQQLPTVLSLWNVPFCLHSCVRSFPPPLSVGASLIPQGTCPQPPLGSFDVFQGAFGHGSHSASCPGGGIPRQPPAPAQRAPLGWGQRRDLWRCSWAVRRVASPPPRAPQPRLGPGLEPLDASLSPTAGNN